MAFTERTEDMSALCAIEKERDVDNDSFFRGLWTWVRAQKREPAFAAVTFAAMVLGLMAEKLDWPSAAPVAFYAVAYLTGGIFGVRAGIASLLKRAIDIDLLMVLAALGAAYVGAPFEGAMLLFLFSLSNVLQNYAMDRTRSAIQSLMKLRPDRAFVCRNGQIEELAVEEIEIDDRVVVRPGGRIPLDGVVIEGESTVDQSSITGESVPVAKGTGDGVFAGTFNKTGSFEMRVTKRSRDSTLSRLIQLVEEARSEKAQTQRFLERAEQYYAMGVIGIVLLAIAVPVLMLGEAFQTAFYRAMTLMVAASPCALIISTPATILSAIGNGARRGVLFKGGAYVERTAGIRVVVFDKTGTLTEGKPRVTDVAVVDGSGLDEDGLLQLAAAVEDRSEHHLGRAVIAAAQQRDLDLPESFAFQSTTGKGVCASVDGKKICVGNPRFFETLSCIGLETALSEVKARHAEGKTSVIVAQVDDAEQQAQILGAISFADMLRPNAKEVVRELKAMGIEKTVMLTGDNARVADAIARQVGVDSVYADLLPEDKVRAVQQVQAQFGPVAMIGDGVNDAPALATAAVGVAMGAAGTDVALETADVVLMSDDLQKIPYALALSRKARQTLMVNLGFAMGMIVLMVGAIFFYELSLPLAVIGHEGGTVLVSLNGLRLLVYQRKNA